MSLALAPLGLLYGALVRTRLGLYRSGFLKTQTVGAPVISVGNITAGGTGHTPTVGPPARAARGTRARGRRSHHARRHGRRPRRLARGSSAADGRARRGRRLARADAGLEAARLAARFQG